MASLSKRRKADGSTVWDAQVKVVGYPAACKTFTTKLEAQSWAARVQASAKGRTLALSRDTTLTMLIDQGMPLLRNPTVAAFAYWREQLGTLRLIDITPNVIAVHRDRLLGAPCGGYNHRTIKPRSPSTVRNYLIELSRLFTLAIKELRVMDANPCSSIRKPAASRGVVRFLSDDERTALLAACRQSDQPDLYPFVLLALTTGARKGEVAALQWRHVDLARRWAVFPTTKNGSARGVPLTAPVVKLLRSRDRDDERVFPVDITRAWHTAIARAGIRNFRFHDLRHSCASTLVMSGASLPEVAALLGHKTQAMTMRYSHLSGAHTTALVDRVNGRMA